MIERAKILFAFAMAVMSLSCPTMLNAERLKSAPALASRFPDDDADKDGLTNAVEAELGTDLNNPDSDSDEVRDGDDAIPYEVAMTVRSASDAKYMIVDMGTIEQYGEPRGVNDKAEALLVSQVNGFFWKGGVMTQIGSTVASSGFVVGPLNNGSVYFIVPGSSDRNVEEVEPNAVWEETERWDSNMMKFTVTGAPVVDGITNVYITQKSTDGVFMFADIGNLGLPASVRSGFLTFYGSSMNLFDGHFAEYDLDEYHATSLTESWSYTTGINDAGVRMVSGKVESWAYEYTAIPKDSETGMSEVSNSYCKVNVWGTSSNGVVNSTLELFTTFDWIKFDGKWIGRPLSGLRENSGGYGIFSLENASVSPVDYSNLEGYIYYGAERVNLPSSTLLSDLNNKISPEGPYVLGKTSGRTSHLWCYGNGKPVGLTIPGEFEFDDRKYVVGRKISERLEIPIGSYLWKNGRKRSTKELCGHPRDWAAIHISQISPRRGVLIGTAIKDENGDGRFDFNSGLDKMHSILLVPIEIKAVISDQIPENDANMLPTAFFGGNPAKPGNGEPNNPILMATSQGQQAKIRVKVEMPDFNSFVGVRKVGNRGILAEARCTSETVALSFTVAENSSDMYEVVAGYDCNGNGVFDYTEAQVVFEKTPRIDKEGNSSRTNLKYIDKMIVVDSVKYAWSKRFLHALGGTFGTGYAGDLLHMFINAATTVPHANRFDVDTVGRPIAISAKEPGLSHPVGAKWDSNNSDKTFLIQFDDGSQPSDDVENSIGVSEMISSFILFQRFALIEGYSSGSDWQTTEPMTFSMDVNFFDSEVVFPNRLGYAFGKVTIRGQMRIKYRVVGPFIQVNGVELSGAFSDIYDFAYGPASPAREASMVQAGYASLATKAEPNSGKVFFTKVLFNAGWSSRWDSTY